MAFVDKGVHMRTRTCRHRTHRLVPRRDAAATGRGRRGRGHRRRRGPREAGRGAAGRGVRARTRTRCSPPASTALVITAATAAHPELIVRGVAAGVPVFCEKPVATDIVGTLRVVDEIASSDVPVQIGFQRRFDAGYASRPRRRPLRAARLGAHAARRHDGRGATARRVRAHVRRLLPRLQRARLRHHPVGHRPARSPRCTRSARTGAPTSSGPRATSTPPPRC